jgi:hypothetical protein
MVHHADNADSPSLVTPADSTCRQFLLKKSRESSLYDWNGTPYIGRSKGFSAMLKTSCRNR